MPCAPTLYSRWVLYKFLFIVIIIFMHPVIWLPAFWIFNVHTDVDACSWTQGLYVYGKRVCTGSWLWEIHPLPHWGLEPASVFHLAFQSYILPAELPVPQVILEHNLKGNQTQSPLPRCTIWHNHRPVHLTGVIFKGLILWKFVFDVCVKLYLRWSLCTLHLHVCQVRVGDSALCCCTCVTSFDAN